MTMHLEPTDVIDRMRCPTCGAEQAWSGQCRRCRCDLRQLHDMWRRWQHAKQQCLTGLRDGETATALAWARVCYHIFAGEASARLLATCYLELEDWQAAARLAHRAVRELTRR